MRKDIRALLCPIILGLIAGLILSVAVAQGGELAIDLPATQRARYANPDGSCVQCALGMHGCWLSNAPSSMLLWDSEYGSRVRGGSGPERVARYCRERSIAVHNVTGPGTIDWVLWSLRTGRGAAVLYGPNHFVTAVGYRPATGEVAICDNNSPSRIQWMSMADFRRRHLAWGGQGWVVILQGPSAPGRDVRFLPWWRIER